MKDVSELTVKQYRIFRPGVIPFALVRSGPGTQFITSAYGFAEAGPDPLGTDLVFQHGALRANEDPEIAPIAVAGIHLNERRVIVGVHGSSQDATLAYMSLASVFKKLDPTFATDRLPEPLVFTEETTCVVHLDIDWPAVLSSQFGDFVERELVPAASFPNAQAIAVGAKVSIAVNFEQSDPFFRENGITYAAKEFSIQPQARVPLSERRFVVSSPMSSDRHLELVDRLGAVLSQKG